jgi:GTPase involved in cell partitioning and DNA repair
LSQKFLALKSIATWANESVEKVTFLKNASSAESKIGNYDFSSKVFTILGVMFLFP